MLLLLPACYCSRMFYFPYVKEHELLDKVFFFVKLRIIYSTTQASAISIPIFVPKRCRTARYQNSFFIRKARISNPLTGRMELAIATLTGFKSLLYDYDSRAVRMNYNLDNPQTFKTICLKCDSTRFSWRTKNVLHLKGFFFLSYIYFIPRPVVIGYSACCEVPA